jgi:tRNA pseudouridine synthase 10
MRSALQVGINLCKHCLEREGIRGQPAKFCDICGGLLERLDSSADEIINKLSDYEYETFLVGASIPQSVLDKEDELRSLLKIKGKESVKSQITRMLTRKISKFTGKHANYSRPDITILLSLSDGMIAINPRSIWLSARYLKHKRGISQRATDCKNCNGLGCATCNYLGKTSENIQSIATSYFCRRFLAEGCNFVWLGSEDENSLVKGSGRPFFAEVLRPKKRLTMDDRSKFKPRLSFRSSDIKIFKFVRLEKRITEVPQFDVKCVVHLARKENEPPQELQVVEIEQNFSEAIVNVRLTRKYRVVQRMIHSIKAKTTDGGAKAELLIECEGGVPLKKLVTGQDDSVDPNLSHLLSQYEIDQQKPFDILDVKMRKTQPKPSRRGREQLTSNDGNLQELSEDA